MQYLRDIEDRLLGTLTPHNKKSLYESAYKRSLANSTRGWNTRGNYSMSDNKKYVSKKYYKGPRVSKKLKTAIHKVTNEKVEKKVNSHEYVFQLAPP